MVEKTTAEWRQWVHDNVDIHSRDLVIDRKDFLAILSQLDEAREQAARVQAMWDDERQRL